MTIIVENGTIVSGANSYVTTAELTTFATARGVTLVTGAEQLLIRAMDYIEKLKFKGTKYTRDQALEWPRLGVVIDGYTMDVSTIPADLKNGLMQCAIAIDQGNDPLQDAPRATKSEKVGPLEVVYSDSASATVLNKKIINTLWKLLSSGNGGNNLPVNKG